MAARQYYTYILTNKNRTVLYIGITNSLQRRLHEHQNEAKGFVKLYGVCHLIYFETFPTPLTAIKREKEIKKWRREKKEALVATTNPNWEFLDHLFVDTDQTQNII